MSDGSRFYNDMNIEQALELCVSDSLSFIFWMFWIVLMIIAVCGFYYLDNRWLE
jgi:hypothetical protein